MALVYSSGNWNAKTFKKNLNELKLFKDVYLTSASICTTVSNGDVYLELGAGAKWYYEDSENENDPGKALAVSGVMKYDGDYFEATLMLGEEDGSTFEMPSPFPDSIEIQNVKMEY